jgi:hypothetical protein
MTVKRNEGIKKQNRLMKKTNRTKIIALSGVGLFLTLALFSTLVNGANVGTIRPEECYVVSMEGQEIVVDHPDGTIIGDTAAPQPSVKILSLKQSPNPNHHYRFLINYTLENLGDKNHSVNVTFQIIYKYPLGKERKITDPPMQFSDILCGTMDDSYPLFRFGIYHFTMIIKLTSTGAVLDQKSITWTRHIL